MGTAATMQIEEKSRSWPNFRGKRRTTWPGITKRERDEYRICGGFWTWAWRDRLTSKVGLLSGGQRQALTPAHGQSTSNPKLLLLDLGTPPPGPQDSGRSGRYREDQSSGTTTTLMITKYADAIAHGNSIMMHRGQHRSDIR